MTPAEWDSTDDVLALLYAAAGTASDRRLRLLMLAYARTVSPPPEVRSFGEAVRLLARLINGRVPPKRRMSVERTIRRETNTFANHPTASLWCEVAGYLAAGWVEFRTPWLVVSRLIQVTADPLPPPIALLRSRPHADLLRDILRPPHALLFADEWRSETVRALAAGIDAEGAFDRLPILADALEEAGCDSPGLLAHCCGPGPHTPHCWSLDLVQGRY